MADGGTYVAPTYAALPMLNAEVSGELLEPSSYAGQEQHELLARSQIGLMNVRDFRHPAVCCAGEKLSSGGERVTRTTDCVSVRGVYRESAYTTAALLR